MFCSFTLFIDVGQDGEDHYVTNAWYIQAAGMVTVMEVHGNASVILIGVEYCVIKVSFINVIVYCLANRF